LGLESELGLESAVESYRMCNAATDDTAAKVNNMCLGQLC
jgi:hypothetical protein